MASVETVMLTMVGIIIGLVAFFGRQYIEKLNEHVEVCTRRAEYNARMIQWMGDCIYNMANKMDTKLAPRPKPVGHLEDNIL